MYYTPTLPLRATICTLTSAMLSIVVHISLLLGFGALILHSTQIIPPSWSTDSSVMQWYLTNTTASAQNTPAAKPQTVFQKNTSSNTAAHRESTKQAAEIIQSQTKIVPQPTTESSPRQDSINHSMDSVTPSANLSQPQAPSFREEASNSSQETDSSLPLTYPSSTAAHLKNPPPIYPLASRRLEEEGKVLLRVFILANGTVGAIKIQQSSGYERLDHAAIQAVRSWQFMPAKRGNTAIDYWHIQPIQFTLES